MLISKNLHKKSSDVSIQTSSTPASLSFIGQVTKHTTVKWTILGCHISNFFLPEDCAELITDPLKVFDSFSVFVEPISYQRIFHLVSVFYITAHLAKS